MKRRYMLHILRENEATSCPRELSVCKGVGGVLVDFNTSREKCVVEVVYALSEELSLAYLQRYTGVLQQCEHFINMLDVVLDLA